MSVGLSSIVGMVQRHPRNDAVVTAFLFLETRRNQKVPNRARKEVGGSHPRLAAANFSGFLSAGGRDINWAVIRRMFASFLRIRWHVAY